MIKPILFPIAIHKDERGELKYCNEFDMSHIKRFYEISFAEQYQVRAWQAHQVETKAILPQRGVSKVVLVKVEDFDHAVSGEVFEFILDAKEPKILLVPAGYANGLQSITEDASLMIYSNLNLEEAKKDDFRFDKNMFYTWE